LLDGRRRELHQLRLIVDLATMSAEDQTGLLMANQEANVGEDLKRGRVNLLYLLRRKKFRK
jgi:hypothetical protein